MFQIIQIKNKIKNCLLGCGMKCKEGVMVNVIVLVVNVGALIQEGYWYQQLKDIVGNMDMLRGAWISSIGKSLIIY